MQRPRLRRSDLSAPTNGAPKRKRSMGLWMAALARALDVPELRLFETGGDAYEAEREQWDDGNNVLAIARAWSSPSSATSTTGLLRIVDLTPAELTALLDVAEAFKADPLRRADALAGESVACYSSKPSTRTRISFEAASVPVINALTDDHHPCQALADLLTLRERFGDPRGLRVAYVGDGNNVAHSLIEAAALTGIDLRLACPDGYRPDPVIAADAYVVTNPRQAVAGARAVYTDVGVSMGDDAERERRLDALRPYRVTPGLMGLAAPDAVFLHCLPAHRGEEVATAVIDGTHSAVWQQAAIRLPTVQAALYALVSGDWEV